MIVLAKKSESHRLVIGKNIVQANKSKESVTQDSDTRVFSNRYPSLRILFDTKVETTKTTKATLGKAGLGKK